MKTCTVCKNEKPLTDFYNMKASKDGKASRCKTCDNLARKKWVENNPKQSAYSARNRQLQHKYGITIEVYEKMLKDQGGCCAICKTKENAVTGRNKYWNFSVDHCHTTGKVRGLLCNACNRGIGFLKDDVNVLEAATDYLRNNQ